MAEDIKDKLRKKVSVSYLNKDFEGFIKSQSKKLSPALIAHLNKIFRNDK